MAGFVTKSQAIVPTDYVVVDMMLNNNDGNPVDVTLVEAVTEGRFLYQTVWAKSRLLPLNSRKEMAQMTPPTMLLWT